AGTGGDELFAGYPRYQGMLAFQRYRHAPEPLRRAAAIGARTLLYDAMDGSLGSKRVRRFLEAGTLPFDECYLHWLVAIDTARKQEVYSNRTRAQLNGADAFGFLREPLQDD